MKKKIPPYLRPAKSNSSSWVQYLCRLCRTGSTRTILIQLKALKDFDQYEAVRRCLRRQHNISFTDLLRYSRENYKYRTKKDSNA